MATPIKRSSGEITDWTANKSNRLYRRNRPIGVAEMANNVTKAYGRAAAAKFASQFSSGATQGTATTATAFPTARRRYRAMR